MTINLENCVSIQFDGLDRLELTVIPFSHPYGDEVAEKKGI